MNANLRGHCSEEILEKYAMGGLAGPDCTLVEEHLLVCSACQDDLEQLDEYVRVIQSAIAILSPDPSTNPRQFPHDASSDGVYEPELPLCS